MREKDAQTNGGKTVEGVMGWKTGESDRKGLGAVGRSTLQNLVAGAAGLAFLGNSYRLPDRWPVLRVSSDVSIGLRALFRALILDHVGAWTSRINYELAKQSYIFHLVFQKVPVYPIYRDGKLSVNFSSVHSKLLD